MLDDAYAAVGAKRLIWGADITLCTGLAKRWALGVIGLTSAEMAAVRWRHAVRVFPQLRWEPGTGNREQRSQVGGMVPGSPFPVPVK